MHALTVAGTDMAAAKVLFVLQQAHRTICTHITYAADSMYHLLDMWQGHVVEKGGRFCEEACSGRRLSRIRR